MEIVIGMQASLVLVAYQEKATQMIWTLEPVLLRSAFVGMVMMETGLMMVDVTSSVKYSDETDLKVVSLCHLVCLEAEEEACLEVDEEASSYLEAVITYFEQEAVAW